MEYLMKVYTDVRLTNVVKKASSKKQRFIKKNVDEFMNLDSSKICILYGLRRTGKTFIMLQTIHDLINQKKKCAYIICDQENEMSELINTLDKLEKLDIKYVFIDEITRIERFINESSILADYYAMSGMKIVLAGTDSLGFHLSEQLNLDRFYMIHTTYIPYYEFSYLLNENDTDIFIEYGGTLIRGDEAYKNNYNIYEDETSLKNYLDSAIANNIQNSLSNYFYGTRFGSLVSLYKNDELTNLINRIIEFRTHFITINLIRKLFKSHDYGSGVDLFNQRIKKGKLDLTFEPLTPKEKKLLVSDLKKEWKILDYNETKISLTQKMIDEVYDYLKKLDFLKDYTCLTLPVENEGDINHYILSTQVGIRYAQVKFLINRILNDDYLKEKNDSYTIETLKNIILQDVKGRMLEEITILDAKELLSEFKYNSFERYCIKQINFKHSNGEYDLLIYDRKHNTCEIYEIKHSNEVHDRQFIHLINEEKNKLVTQRFGEISKKVILYKGSSFFKEDVNIYYKNIEEFLCELSIYPIRELYQQLQNKLTEKDKDYLLYSDSSLEIKEIYLYAIDQECDKNIINQIKVSKSMKEIHDYLQSNKATLRKKTKNIAI